MSKLLLGVQQQSTVLQSLHRHVERRVDEFYPSQTYTDSDGAIPPELLSFAQAQAAEDAQQPGYMPEYGLGGKSKWGLTV